MSNAVTNKPSPEEPASRLRESSYKGPLAKAMEKMNQAFWNAFIGEPDILEDPGEWHRRRKARRA